jgi:hypothetical protein
MLNTIMVMSLLSMSNLAVASRRKKDCVYYNVTMTAGNHAVAKNLFSVEGYVHLQSRAMQFTLRCRPKQEGLAAYSMQS